MHLATVAAVTLALLSSACTIQIVEAPADESESTSTTVESTTEQAESSSSTGELEDNGSSTGREIGSSSGEVGGENSTGDDTTGEVDGSSGGESSSTGDDNTTSDASTTSGEDDDSSTGFAAKAYGESCEKDADCDSDLCHADSCTVACTQAVANDCGGLGVPGLCIELAPETFGCAGDLTFGDDPDDARLTIASDGDFLVRSFQSADDADLFLLDMPVGVYSIDAAPVTDADVQLELYDDQAAELGVINNAGESLPEAVEVDHTGGVLFVVIRSVGQQTGDHTFHFQSK